MSIKYSLTPNNLNKETNSYIARVHTDKTIGLREIAEQMAKEGAIISADNIQALLHQVIDVIESQLVNGCRVNFNELVTFYPSIKGTFAGITDRYDPSRHKIYAGARAGSRVLKTIFNESSMKKVITPIPQPVIYEYIDVQSEEINNTVNSSATATINGQNLRYNTAAEDEGIFFINNQDLTELKVTGILRVHPREIIFQTPREIAQAAEYTLEIRSRLNGGTKLRSGKLEQKLVGA